MQEKPIHMKAGLPSASDYQIDIFHAVEKAGQAILDGEPATSLIIDAKPGSGKTTTGIAATRLIPAELSSIFVAFNKKIADELATRLPRGIAGRTFHAHWLRQWGRYCQKKYRKWPEVNNFKIKNAVDKYFGIDYRKRNSKNTNKSEDQQALEDKVDHVVFLVEKAKLFGVVPQGYDGATSTDGMGDCDEFWEYMSVFFDHQIEPEQLPELIDIAREILVAGLDNEIEIDFSDMLYMPAVKRVVGETYQVVMVDECQDLSSLQHYLIGRMLDRNGIVIAIGDRRQSIYGFIGADIESMDRLKEQFDCEEFPLSISYRCAEQIVDLAYEIYPEIEARPNAPAGSVEYPKVVRLDDFKPGDLIICRNNRPTVDLAYRLIRNRIPAKVVGRDIGKGLTKIIKRLDVDGTIPPMIDRLREWRERQIAIIERKPGDQERAKANLEDKYQCIDRLAATPEARNVAALIALIESLFTDAEDVQIVSANRVTLSTIHKIKGAEADTVYILDPHLINAPWMKGEGWKFIQEENLRFVAITRAKTRLIFVRTDQID